jgi:hypothetical protein
MSGLTKEIHGPSTKLSKDTRISANAAGIFIEGDIASVMKRILDQPVITLHRPVEPAPECGHSRLVVYQSDHESSTRSGRSARAVRTADTPAKKFV